jgi:hypothetical protein
MKPKNSPHYRPKTAFVPFKFRSHSDQSEGSDDLIKDLQKLRKQANITAKNALDKAEKMQKLIKKASTTKIGKYILDAISNGIASLANNSQDTLPAYTKESVAKITTSNLMDVSKVYVIRFHVGQKSTQSVIQAEKQNGSANIELTNSLSDGQDIIHRKLLSRSFGFNQKSIDFLDKCFHVTVKDYVDLYNILGWTLIEFGTQVPYGLAKEEFLNVKIRNSSTYHRLKFKLHLVKILDDDVTMSILFSKTFNKFSTKQNTGCIPMVYQLSDLSEKENKIVNSMLCYNGASVNQASNFQSQAKIVKTFSKMLNPGDTLDFRMTHHLGPGIRFDLAKSYMINPSSKGEQPSGYGMIVEVIGTSCEAVRIQDGAAFQGTCPGWYTYEYRKGVTLVRNSRIVSSQSELGDNFDQKYAIKVYERVLLQNPPLSVSVNDIGKPGEKDKTFMIVSTSAESPVYSANIAGIPESNISKKYLTKSFDEYYDTEEDEKNN